MREEIVLLILITRRSERKLAHSTNIFLRIIFKSSIKKDNYFWKSEVKMYFLSNLKKNIFVFKYQL